MMRFFSSMMIWLPHVVKGGFQVISIIPFHRLFWLLQFDNKLQEKKNLDMYTWKSNDVKLLKIHFLNDYWA